MNEYDQKQQQQQVVKPVEPFSSNLLNDDYDKIILKLDEFANSTLNIGEALLKKIDEIGVSSDSYIRETADRIAKNSVEISNSSLSFLKRTKDAIGQHIAARIT